MEIVKKHEECIQSISPIFKDVEQREIVINPDSTIIIEHFTINGCEFAKQFIRDPRFNHVFKDITFIYDYYNHLIFVDDKEIYSGIELLHTINDELNEYNKIEDLAYYFFGKNLNGISLNRFLNIMFEFNYKFEDAVEDLDKFISENEDKLLSMEV